MKKLVIILFFFQVLTGCIFFKPDYLVEITPAELARYQSENDIFLVDVHIPEQKHIKGTDLFVPYNRIKANLHLFPADKSTPIFLYCEGGPMGNAAAHDLYENGYKKLYNLKGGSEAWHEAGYEFQE